MSAAIATRLPQGNRLHLQHGPIDLIIDASGNERARERAFILAARRFASILDELVVELPILRRPLLGVRPSSAVGQRMATAVAPYVESFITPMAAVAGAVADEILHVMMSREIIDDLERIYVNNGGDIALYLSEGARYEVGLVPDPRSPSVVGKMIVQAPGDIRGIATSGRHGRSMSLGIADSVTVLARDAAGADAAATLVANAVDLPGHRAVTRIAADELDPDTDLGDTPVTTDVADLSREDIDDALGAGRGVTQGLLDQGLLDAAVLILSGRVERMGNPDGRTSASSADRGLELVR